MARNKFIFELIIFHKFKKNRKIPMFFWNIFSEVEKNDFILSIDIASYKFILKIKFIIIIFLKRNQLYF
jgi:hypothetical protein